jgi:hypothetical protein
METEFDINVRVIPQHGGWTVIAESGEYGAHASVPDNNYVDADLAVRSAVERVVLQMVRVQSPLTP